ncbi:MAG: ParB/RepB/Spo0J family partition protein [Armatimonadota bacterium]|nr:ParB/RepB/Spo0J family partition protein [Armatimonadota bacterium]
MSWQVLEVPIDRIEVPSVRVTNYLPPEVAEELRQSVGISGLLEPVLLLADGDRLILVDGLNRLIAAKEAGQTTVPAVIRPGSLREALLQNLQTSTQRGNYKHSEVRRVIAALEEEYGLDTEELCRRTGMSYDRVSRYQWVNRAIPEVQEALDRGEIPLGHAALIGRFDAAHDQELLFALYVRYRPPLAVFEEMCRRREEIKSLTAVDPNAYRPQPPASPQADLACENCARTITHRQAQFLVLCPACYGEVWRSVHPEADRADA